MKKKLLFLTVIFSLLLSNVFSQTVYVTKTGKKYHNENCRYLNKSSFTMELSDAIAKGYEACSVCKPPTTVNSQTPTQTKTTKQESPNFSPPTNQGTQSVSVQCSATTKAGTRCKRMTKSPNGKCWQHGGN